MTDFFGDWMLSMALNVVEKFTEFLHMLFLYPFLSNLTSKYMNIFPFLIYFSINVIDNDR